MDNKHWYLDFDNQFWLLGAKSHDAAAHAAFVKKVLRLRAGQSVLDAPCGRGRIGLYLAKSGCRVTGVDRNRTFLATARQRFRRHGVSGTFLIRDLRNLGMKDAFHAAFSWFSSFGYFSDAENLAVLRQLAAAVRPGGRVLIDVSNREFRLRRWRPCTKHPDVVTHDRWLPQTQRWESTWIPTGLLPRAKRSHFSLRLYTPRQMRQMFQNIGLDVVACYGRTNGELHSTNTPRMIMIGRKS